MLQSPEGSFHFNIEETQIPQEDVLVGRWFEDGFLLTTFRTPHEYPENIWTSKCR